MTSHCRKNNIPSTTRGFGETENDFWVRLKEDAHYYNFETLKTFGDREGELIRLRFLVYLKDKEGKFKFLDALRITEKLTAEELSQTL